MILDSIVYSLSRPKRCILMSARPKRCIFMSSLKKKQNTVNTQMDKEISVFVLYIYMKCF